MRYILKQILIRAIPPLILWLSVLAYLHFNVLKPLEHTVDTLTEMNKSLEQTNNEITEINRRQMDDPSRSGNRRWMEITAYTAGFESTGKGPGHPEYGITAMGYRLTDADAWKVAAADPRYYPPGTRVNVAGVGTVKIVDTGSDVKGPDRLDIFAGMTAVDEADAWGRQQRQVVIE